MKKNNFTVTNFIIFINVLVFIGSIFTLGTALSIQLFGLNSPITIKYITYITSAFTHASITHLIFNMYILYFVGNILEGYLKKPSYIIYYFTVTIFSGFLTSMFSDALVVGASGVVFALLTTCVVLSKSDLPDFYLYNPSRLMSLLILNLVLTFIIPGISIMGHISGVVAGLIASLIIISVKERR